MENYQDILNIFKNKWKTIVSVFLGAIFASIALTFAIPSVYKTHTELLIVQKQSDWSESAYTASQSAERVATTFTQVIPSSSFMDRVMDSEFDIEDTFSKNPEKRKEEWQDTVEAKIIKNTGIIEIDVYSQDKEQTKQITYAIADILMKKGDRYHGSGDRIEVRMFDKPIASDKPAYPNMLINISIGTILGLMFGFGIIFIPKKEKNISEQ